MAGNLPLARAPGPESPQTRTKWRRECPSDAAIVAAIIAMARALRMGVVAEGVETLEQAEIVRDLGCDDLQGYLFSPAVPPEEFRRFLEEGKRE